MNPYQEIFYPIFGVACLIAAIASYLAAWRSGIVFPLLLLFVGVFTFWGGLFLGAELGYQVWQSIPDPPDEAFSDAFPSGALLFGWLPGGMFCSFFFGFGWCLRMLGKFISPTGRQVGNATMQNPRSEDGNPFRSPDN